MPPEEHGLVDSDAPLNTWSLLKSFDSAAECQAYHDHKVYSEGDWYRQHIREHGPDHQAAILYEQWIAAECIASDDPRLKETK